MAEVLATRAALAALGCVVEERGAIAGELALESLIVEDGLLVAGDARGSPVRAVLAVAVDAAEGARLTALGHIRVTPVGRALAASASLEVVGLPREAGGTAQTGVLV